MLFTGYRGSFLKTNNLLRLTNSVGWTTQNRSPTATHCSRQNHLSDFPAQNRRRNPRVSPFLSLFHVGIPITRGIIIIKKDWQCKAGRGRLTPYQSEDTSPTLPTYRGKEEKGKIVEDKNEEQLGQQKGIGLPLKTRQSHTIEYGVNQVVPERYWEGNKRPAVLRGSAAGRSISIPMCDQSTACNPDWHIRHR